MIYKWIKYYSWKYIIDDALAAISVSTVIIPQSLAYSQLAKLPAVYGLYVSIIPPLVYTLLGSHPYTSIGAFAIVSIVLAESLSSISISENDFVGFASFLAFLVGLVELLLAVSGILNFLSRFLFKHSFISGFTVASVLTIITSQLKPFFGLQFQSQNGLFSVPKTWYLVIANIKTTNVATLALSISTVFLIRVSEFTETSIRKCLRKRKSKKMHAASNQQNQDQNMTVEDNESVVVSFEDNADEKTMNIFPSILFAVILLTFVSKLMNLPANYNVRIVGNIPSGLPPFSWPWAVLSNINKDALFLVGQLIYRVLSLVIVCTLTSASVTDLYPGSNPQKAQSHLSLEILNSEERLNKQEVLKGNSLSQEVFALSVSGILGSFFSCYTPSASLSRSAILANQTNVKSTLWNLLSAIFVILVVYFLDDFFQNIPLGILSAVILVAISPSAKNIRVVVALFKKARLDYKAFKETLRSSNDITPQEPDVIIVSNPETSSPGNALETVGDQIIESAHQESQQPASGGQETRDNFPIVETAATREEDCASTRLFMPKVPLSLKIGKGVTIWSDFLTWIATFAIVLLIDVSAGIYAGLIIVLLLYGIVAISKNLNPSEG